MAVRDTSRTVSVVAPRRPTVAPVTTTQGEGIVTTVAGGGAGTFTAENIPWLYPPQQGPIVTVGTRTTPPPGGNMPTVSFLPGGNHPTLGPSPVTSPMTIGGPGGVVDTGICDRISDPTIRALCKAGASVLPGGSTSSTPGQGSNLATNCPDGYARAADGSCRQTGIGGAVERFLPGGGTGTLAGDAGTAVVDDFGNPALLPMEVGTITRNDGSVGPILRCRAGMVLGMNNLCYVKGTLPRALRKWKPAAKPPMTAADAKALRRIGALQGKVKRLSKAAGFTCKKK